MSDTIYREDAIKALDVSIYKDDIEDAINAIPSADRPQGWIPCSERLPEELQEVLVTSTHGYVYTSRIVHGDFEYGGNVLAWMPLPKPWKGADDDL